MTQSARSLTTAGVLMLALNAVLVVAMAEAPARHGSPGTAALREPWSRGHNRFVRQWLLLRPPSQPGTPKQASGETHDLLRQDFLASWGGEASVRPAPNLAHVLPDGSTVRWIPYSGYRDVVDLSEALVPVPRRSAFPEVAYAYAALHSDSDWEGLLSVGSDGGLRIWFNGDLVHEQRSARSFTFDEDRVKVRLRKGDNQLLLKLDHRVGPWRFALRVLAPGAEISRREEIAPSIVSMAADQLTVRTHKVPELAAAPVRIAVIAAGGVIVAQREAPRGELVQFPIASWPEGALEVRCTTQTAWGRTFTRHLPVYKGDAIAAARRLIDLAGSAPADAEGGAVRLLADMVLDRLGGGLKDIGGDAWRSVHSPLLEFQELEQARAGRAGNVRPWGFVRLAYLDDVDGSPQFCRAYLPSEYDPSRRWPVVVYLHGYNPPNPPYLRWWAVDERHNTTAEQSNVIFLEPHARGNAQYLGIGERDVLRCLDEARRRFSVDDDRVYLMGESMGGSGTWIVGSRHPELFAAVAPIFGGWDWRLVRGYGLDSNPPDMTLPERFLRESQSSFAGAEGLLNVPLFIHHGDQDQTVSVEHSRHVVRMLQRWGYDLRYEEHVGWGHEDLGARERTVEWLLSHRRVTAPRRVRLRAMDLAGAAAHWVQVGAWEEPLRAMMVDTEVIQPGLVRLDTSNVAEVTLSPPAELRGKGPLKVVWNGQAREVELSPKGFASLSLAQETAAPLKKQPALEGCLSNLITTPFAVVVGTASSEALMRQLCRQKADAFARLWNVWQHHPARVFRDDQITSTEEQRYSLLLIGGPDDNLVTRRIAPQIPLRLERDAVTVDGRRLPASDAVIQMIYPSPFRADRYVLVVAATSPSGLYFWNPALWHEPLGYPTRLFDWSIHDGRRVTLEEGWGPERGWVAAGVFDRHWRRDDRWVFLGIAALRARSPLRGPQPGGFSVAGEILDSYSGKYELYPGYVVSVFRDGRRLLVEFPPAPPVELTPETDTEFAFSDTALPLVFDRNAQNKVTGFIVYNEGWQAPAKKLE